MIIAYDLRYASDHFAGIGTYAYSLIEELLALPGDERYILLWNPDWKQTRYDFDRLRSHPRVEWVERGFHPIRPQGAMQVGGWLRRVRPAVYMSPFGLRPLGSGCPEVLTLHDVAPLRLPPPGFPDLLFRLSLWLALGARYILTVSEFSRREILALTRARAEQVRAILPGVAPFSPRLEPVRPGALTDDRFALLVGDNRPRKNIEVAVRAWATMGAAPPFALVAAGPVRPGFPSLQELAAAAGARRVVQLGWVEPAELGWLYAHAEMLLLPSLYEGFGSPLAEGLAHGLPVLASDIPAFREVGAEAAVYVDPHDAGAWAREALRIAEDAGVRARLRPAGLARAAELTYRKTAEGALAVLREAARAGRP